MELFKGYKITSPYGYRNDPFTGKKAWHSGIDLVKQHKAPILAFVTGTVVHAKEGVRFSGFGGFGITVAIKDSKGYLHCYCHLNSCNVKVGQYVQQGQEVGKQGTTGRSTGSHLHYEIRKRSWPSYGFRSDVDPGEYLEQYYREDEEELKLDAMQKTMLINALR